MYVDFLGKSVLSTCANASGENGARLGPRSAAVTVLISAVAILLAPSACFTSVGRAWAVTTGPSKGTLWVYAVGVSNYRNSTIDLLFADNDAQTLADTLAQRAVGVFANVNRKVLINDQVTRRSVIDAMLSFFAQAGSADTGIIALMGHGVTANGTFYYVPYPADLSNLATEGLPVAEFETAVQQVSAKLARTVLVVDTCHAAALNFQVRDLADLASRNRRARGISLVGELVPKLPEA